MIKQTIKNYNDPKFLTYGNMYKKFKNRIPVLILMFSIVSALKVMELIIGLTDQSRRGSKGYRTAIWFDGRRRGRW